jgi:GST-like protein
MLPPEANFAGSFSKDWRGAMLKLYATTGESQVVERAAIMLEECGLPYQRHDIQVGRDVKKSEEFLRFSPRGTVPVLVDGDSSRAPVVINQAGAIMLYLGEKTGKFVPMSLDKKAIVYQWFMSALTDAQPTSMAAFLVETQVPSAAEAEACFQSIYVDLCRFFNSRLGEVPYLAGDEVSVADLALITTIQYRRRWVEKIDGIPNLNRWIKSMLARPAVNKIIGNRK